MSQLFSTSKKPIIKEISKEIKKITFSNINNDINTLAKYKQQIYNWIIHIEENIVLSKRYEVLYDKVNNKLEEGLSIYMAQKYSNKKKFTYYPEYLYSQFNKVIYSKKEFNINKLEAYSDKILELRKNNENFKLTNTQNFIKTFMSTDTPYKGLLLWHGVGVGKTCGAISIAENFKKVKNKKIIILLPSGTLEQNWKDEIFNVKKELNKKKKDTNVQCTLDAYTDELDIEYWKKNLNVSAINEKRLKKKTNKIIGEYYEFKTYRKIANEIEKALKGKNKIEQIKYIQETFSNKVFIMDEIHQTRDNTQKKKRKR